MVVNVITSQLLVPTAFMQIGITVVLLIIAGMIWFTVFHRLKARLVQISKTERQRATMQNFFRIIRWTLLGILVLFLILTFTESFTALGISVGVVGAVLGVALQKPIIGMAAWFIVVTRKPFRVGDRVTINKVTGDVVDITLAYIVLDEVETSGSDKIGRQCSVPTNLLFEADIINHTGSGEYMLDVVTTQITYESNLEKAISIIQSAAVRVTKEYIHSIKQDPFTRMQFAPSGIDVTVKYQTLVRERGRVRSEISEEIYRKFRKNKHVAIAYPHTEIILKKRR